MKGRVLCHLEVTQEWAHQTRSLVLRIAGAGRRMEAPAQPADKEKPPRRNPSGHRKPNAWQFSL